MRWKKSIGDMEWETMISIPIKIRTSNGYYYSLGRYNPRDDVWWDVPTNTVIHKDDLEVLDDSEPDQEELWNELFAIITSVRKYRTQEEFKEAYQSKYTLIRK